MADKFITEKEINDFYVFLLQEEKSSFTVEKYIQDVRAFSEFAENMPITKELVIRYKSSLVKKYKTSSVNSKLAAINSLFSFLGYDDCRVKNIKVQKAIYSTEDQELTKQEYFRLIKAAEKNKRLCMIIKTICATGIRVSELSCFTVEGVRSGVINVFCKNKIRNILIPGTLRKMLLKYAKENRIIKGIIFKTRNGKPVNRSNIWSDMKKLCEKANVKASKVFPHNLRKLFARTFYEIEKDIAKLADILGHSSINTTRIYIITTFKEHKEKIDKLGLVV